MEQQEQYQTNAGVVCAICRGKYKFSSENAHGLVFPRQADGTERDIFICWECCIYLYDRLSAQVSSIAYGALFSTRQRVRPHRFIAWLENGVKHEPEEGCDVGS